MLKIRKRRIKNLKEDIIEKKSVDCLDYVSEKIGAWDLVLVIAAFLVTVVYTILPVVKEHFFPNLWSKYVLITYIGIAVAFILFAIWAYFRKSNYSIIRDEFAKEDKEKEIERYRDKKNEKELVSQLESFAMIVKDITIEQHNGNKSPSTYAQIIANHLYAECQRRFGNDISVSFYDMNEKSEVCMRAFATKIQTIDKPDLYHRGLVSISDESIAKRFYVFCLTDDVDQVYDLPNRKAIKVAFGYRKNKKYTYNQYISFKLKTENQHTLLLEVIAHNNTIISKAENLRAIAADMLWRYGLLIENYWSLITK